MLAKSKEWFHNGSMTLTVKNIPDPIYESLKNEAKQKGRSLNTQIIYSLELHTVDASRRAKMAAKRSELDAFVASLGQTPDSTDLIREDRER